MLSTALRRITSIFFTHPLGLLLNAVLERLTCDGDFYGES
jgi:hypothetical protein